VLARLNVMAGRDHPPNLKPRKFQGEEVWYVEVVWPDGRSEHVGAFRTKAETADWITSKSRAWLDDYEHRRRERDRPRDPDDS
jgi:hypothetical protein